MKIICEQCDVSSSGLAGPTPSAAPLPSSLRSVCPAYKLTHIPQKPPPDVRSINCKHVQQYEYADVSRQRRKTDEPNISCKSDDDSKASGERTATSSGSRKVRTGSCGLAVQVYQDWGENQYDLNSSKPNSTNNAAESVRSETHVENGARPDWLGRLLTSSSMNESSAPKRGRSVTQENADASPEKKLATTNCVTKIAKTDKQVQMTDQGVICKTIVKQDHQRLVLKDKDEKRKANQKEKIAPQKNAARQRDANFISKFKAKPGCQMNGPSAKNKQLPSHPKHQAKRAVVQNKDANAAGSNFRRKRKDRHQMPQDEDVGRRGAQPSLQAEGLQGNKSNDKAIKEGAVKKIFGEVASDVKPSELAMEPCDEDTIRKLVEHRMARHVKKRNEARQHCWEYSQALMLC